MKCIKLQLLTDDVELYVWLRKITINNNDIINLKSSSFLGKYNISKIKSLEDFIKSEFLSKKLSEIKLMAKLEKL